MHPTVKEKAFAIRVPLDKNGRPRISLAPPKTWDNMRGIVPILVDAEIEGKQPVQLTPCANFTLSPITQDDPYVLRFLDVTVTSRSQVELGNEKGLR